MAVTSWKTCGTCANNTGVGSAPWEADDEGGTLVGTEASSDNNVYAGVKAQGSTVSHYLKCTNFGFSSGDVPSGATIDGIEVEIIRYRTSDFVVASTAVLFCKGGTISGNNIGSAADWPTSEGTATYGSSSQLGGLSWTQSDIVASTFGCGISFTNATSRSPDGFSRTQLIEQVRMRVHYTESAGAPKGPQFMGFFN